MKQDLLLHQECSAYPMAKCHQIWTKWIASLSQWQWVQNLCLLQEWVANRIRLNWDRFSHCWNQTQVIHCNIVPNCPANQSFDSFGTVWIERSVVFCSHNQLDSCIVLSLAPVDCDVGWISPRCCSAESVLLSRYQAAVFHFCFFWEAKASGALAKDETRWWWSELMKWLFLMIWKTGYWNRDMFRYLGCYFCIFEGLLLTTTWIKVE